MARQVTPHSRSGVAQSVRWSSRVGCPTVRASQAKALDTRTLSPTRRSMLLHDLRVLRIVQGGTSGASALPQRQSQRNSPVVPRKRGGRSNRDQDDLRLRDSQSIKGGVPRLEGNRTPWRAPWRGKSSRPSVAGVGALPHWRCRLDRDAGFQASGALRPTKKANQRFPCRLRWAGKAP